MKIRTTFSIAFFLLAVPVLAQQTAPAAYSIPDKVNYVRSWVAVGPDTTAGNFVAKTAITKALMTTDYLDGLGRSVQTVIKQGSMKTGESPVDMVTPIDFDAYGREMRKYLPFAANNTGGNTSLNDGLFKANPFQQDSTFSKGQYPGETWFYGQTNFETSPQSRILEAFAPGNSWVGSSGESQENNRHSVKKKYWHNLVADSVRIWSVNNVNGGFATYSTVGIYADGQLQKTVTVDENGKQIIEFKDKNDQVVLKKVQLTATADNGNGKGHLGWLCTYYLYDDKGRLRGVVQPVGVELLMKNSWNPTALSNAILNEQCFRYEYDDRGRMIAKKVPSAGIIYMVYDKWDRLVFTQDSVQRSNSEYLMTKYDELNRPVITGIYPYAGSLDQLRTTADDPGYRFEERVSYWGNGTGYSARCFPTSSFTALTVTYYDDYSWLSALGNPLPSTRSTTNDTYLLTASNTTYPYAQAVIQSSATKGLITGTKTQILGTIDYLYTANFYDDMGRVIQSMNTNIRNGVDVSTTQYGWQGLPLLTIASVGKAGTNSQTIITQTRSTYDSLGRIIKKEMKVAHSKVNSGTMPGSWTIIAENEYDALGQLKKKKLDPAYNSNEGLEQLEYEYNIRGWLLGLNRNYLKDNNAGGYASRFFAFELGYDKNTTVAGENFYHPLQYNGNIVGLSWKSAGDAVRRKYDFRYDAANRLGTADFKQNITATSGGSWTNSEMDYSVTGDQAENDWFIRYDANSNILAMTQRAWKMGTTPGPIDQLAYNYIPYSNKLLNVIDAVNDTNTRLGDFRTSKLHPGVASKNTSTEDFRYDGNGNLIRDLNRDIGTSSLDGIEYNYLNLPRMITVRGPSGSIKGTIKYVYDAAGNKLEKVVDEYPTDSRPVSTITYTLYLSGMAFRSMIDTDANTTDYSDRMQYIGMDEGRIRPRFFAGYPDSVQSFHYDYMLRDHLGNVRMLLTTQRDTAFYPVASMETASLAIERRYYGGIDTGRVNKSTVSGYPSDTYTSPNDFVQKLNGGGPKIGTNIVLKVMTGDKINLFAKSWYKKNGVTPGTPNNALTSILNVLEPAIGGITGSHGGTTLSQLQNTNVLDNQVTAFLNSQSGYTTSKPKAFLNWVLFDEQFKYVAASSGFEQVGADNTLTTHTPAAISISKGGYLYIYVSNETPNVDVFFDNLQVTHIRGPILEETHYYPFGLVMAGISSKALNAGGNDPDCGCPNKKGFNGNEIQQKEFEDRGGLDIYDFNARFYDQQLGRFIQVDPLVEFGSQETLTPYQFSFNNPIRYNDPDGKCPICPAIPFIVEGVKWMAAGIAAYAVTSAVVENAKNSNSEPVRINISAPSFNGNAFVPLSAQVATKRYNDEVNKVNAAQAKTETSKPAGGKVAGSASAGVPPPGGGNGPEPNKGRAKPHGGVSHNDAIDNKIKELNKNGKALFIRKNQQQVDVKGNKVGTNRPDVQYDLYNEKTGEWEHHVVEYDNKAAASKAHGVVIKKNDPSAYVELNVLE